MEQNVKDGLKSVIAVPLASQNKFIGTLLLWSERPNAYGSRDQVILERLASQIAPAVENARLFQEVTQLALALEGIGDAVIFANPQGTLQFVNRAFVRMYGYDPDEIVGKHVSILAPSDLDAQRHADEIYRETLKGVGVVRSSASEKTAKCSQLTYQLA